MDFVNTKQTSARAFIRSLNILLKYARLYSFDHARTAEQFTNAWNELHAAIPPTNEAGLLLGATGAQLLLDGVPIDASPAERSFAQLLSAAGLASIQFTSRVTKEDFERLVRAFPTSNTKPSVLAEQLKTALTGVPTIRINEVRFVAEDSSKGPTLAAGLLTAQTLGADADSMKDWLRDPQKLLQLIAAAEGSRGESGEGSGGGHGGEGTGAGGTGGAGNAGTGSGTGNLPGAGSGAGTGNAGSGAGTGLGAGAGAAGSASGAGSGTGTGSAVAGSGFGGAGAGGGTGSGAPGGQSPYSGAKPGSGVIQRGAGAGPSGSGGPRRGGPGGLGPGGSGGIGSIGTRGPNDSGSGLSGWSTKDEDIL
jgi:hypothetical protein